MGDMADFLIEQGIDELARHQAGMCEGPCPYCEEEEAIEQQQTIDETE